MAKSVTGYSSAQVALHWMVVVLVAFQFLAHDGMVSMWRAVLDGQQPPPDAAVLAYLHIAAGILVLLLVLARIYLRVTRGAPLPPADEPWLLKIFAEVVHYLIYVLLLMLPLTGVIAWFFTWVPAGIAHGWLKNILLGAITLHIAGGVFQHFIRRSDVLMRMFKPQSR